MSCIDFDSETNFQESSRLFGSTSNLVDYQSSPILNDVITDTESSNEVKKKFQAPFNNNLLAANDNKMYENSEKIGTKDELKKKNILDLFDGDSDPSDSIQQEFDKNDSNNSKKLTFSDQSLESNKSIEEQLPVIESVHEKLIKNEPVKEKQPEIVSVKEKQPETELIKELQPQTKHTQQDRKSVV